MDSNFLNAARLKTASIQQVNDALIVLRHFVELNFKLLPLLYELTNKKNKTSRDRRDIVKIRSVYDSYQFDVNASVILMNSPVLELIRKTYASITQKEGIPDSYKHLDRFIREHTLLSQNWERIRNN